MFHPFELSSRIQSRPGHGLSDESELAWRGGKSSTWDLGSANLWNLLVGRKDRGCLSLCPTLPLVRLQGVLTQAEQKLVKALPPEKGRDLLKQVRKHLIEAARPVLEATVLEGAGVRVLSLHHDISTTTGEEVVLFTLTEAPLFREKR